MGRQEVELVRRMCDAFARGDWAAGAEPLHEDVEWDTTTMGVWPEAAVLRGREAVQRRRGRAPLRAAVDGARREGRALPRLPGSRPGAARRR